MYNFACTRCFGWSMPDTMMVPLADYMNHLPVDTQFGVYSKEQHKIKNKVNPSQARSPSEEKKEVKEEDESAIDYSLIYKSAADKAFLEDLDPEAYA